MKLRIKETGELLEDVKFLDTTLHKITIQYLDDGVLREHTIKSLSDVEEVKDYEEPKEFYYIDADGSIKSQSVEDKDFNDIKDGVENLRAIGNYFETKEETEKAAEKLKALTRLKDKEFRFVKVSQGIAGGEIRYKVNEESEEVIELLNLLFGGEE